MVQQPWFLVFRTYVANTLYNQLHHQVKRERYYIRFIPDLVHNLASTLALRAPMPFYYVDFGEPRHYGGLFKDGTRHSPERRFIELELNKIVNHSRSINEDIALVISSRTGQQFVVLNATYVRHNYYYHQLHPMAKQN